MWGLSQERAEKLISFEGKLMSWEHDEQGREWPKVRLDDEQAHTGGHGKELRVHCECRRAWEAMVVVK